MASHCTRTELFLLWLISLTGTDLFEIHLVHQIKSTEASGVIIFFCTSINSRVYSVHFTESGDMATFPVNNLKRFVTCSSGNESINNWPLKWLDKNKLLWIFYSYHLPGEQNGHVVVQWVFVSFHVELLLPLTEAVQAVVSVVRYLQFILSSTGNVGRKRRKQSVNTSKTQHCSWTLIGEQSCCWSAAKIETTRSIW